jgi:hypothetical protein
MINSPCRVGGNVQKQWRAVIAALVLMASLQSAAHAQTADEKGGFSIGQLELSSGYASVQLPPITLGGHLPNDALNADLITSGDVEVDWRRLAPQTQYLLVLTGRYAARARYTALNAPSANVTFGVSHTTRKKWRVKAGVADSIISSDELALQPTPAGRPVEGPRSLNEDVDVAIGRSQSPNAAEAALFVPIDESIVASDVAGNRVMASSVRGEAAYAHSARITTFVRGNFTTIRTISSSNDVGTLLPHANSTTSTAGAGIRYQRSERSQVTVSLDWSQVSGAFVDQTLVPTVEYGWSGQKWFTAATAGMAIRPVQTPNVAEPLTTNPDSSPAIVASGVVGYKFGSQRLLAQYSRAAHGEYGNGGRNIATGFEGDVQSVAGSWLWSAPSSRWSVQSDFSMIRRPGNFSYIFTWLSTTGIGRQLGPNVRLIVEAFFDRHGSRAYEGFHLTQEGVRLNFTWTPRRRSVDET